MVIALVVEGESDISTTYVTAIQALIVMPSGCKMIKSLPSSLIEIYNNSTRSVAIDVC